jgi:hypothetical protein
MVQLQQPNTRDQTNLLKYKEICSQNLPKNDAARLPSRRAPAAQSSSEIPMRRTFR